MKVAQIMLLLAALGIMAASGMVQATDPQISPQLWAEARAEVSHRPAIERPELWSYLAHQEQDAGLSPIAEFYSAFSSAKTLTSPLPLKVEIESDAVAGAVESGDWAVAENMARVADAGQTDILNRIIPAEVAQGRVTVATRIWHTVRTPSKFPFRAASAFLNAAQLPAGETSQVLQQGLRAAGTVRDSAAGLACLDFLAGAPKSGPSTPALVAAYLALWNSPVSTPKCKEP